MGRDWVDYIVSEISGWEGISAASHRFGGTEFNLGAVEVGHIHRGGMVDIPYTVALRETLVAAGETGVHHLLQNSGWTTYYVRSDADAQHALRLYRLAYLHKRYRKPSDRVTAVYRDEVRALGFNDAVIAAMYPARGVASSTEREDEVREVAD